MGTDKNVALPKDYSEIAEELEAAYWVPFIRTPFKGLDEIEEKSKYDCPELHQAFSAFNSNIKAAKDLLEFPYLLLIPFLPDVRTQIQVSPPGITEVDDSDLSEEQEARAIDLVTVALKASKGPLLEKKSELQRLLHQACILIWSALETFSKQIFIASLNQRPALLTAILKSQELKERFSISNNTWANLLQTHDFDLKGKLGTIIAANRDFSSPQLLRDLFPVMFNGMSTIGFPHSDSQQDTLWKLGQRRHLIAHRCGIVDQDYLDKTHDDSQVIGKLLNLRGRDLGEAMRATAGFAILLYGNARYCWR